MYLQFIAIDRKGDPNPILYFLYNLVRDVTYVPFC